MKTGRPIPLDLLLLLLLVPAHMEIKGISYLLVIPLFFYIVAVLWQPLTSVTDLPEQFGKIRLAFLIRLSLLFMIIIGAAIVPTLTNIYTRLVLEPDEAGYSPAYADIHDGAIQVEYALNFLNEGKNPYVERYEDTPLKYYGFSGINIPTNPAYDHFVYLPGYLTFSYPVYKLFQQFGLPYDQRWIYLLAYIVLLVLIPPMVKPPTLKLTLLAAVGLNPLLTGPVIIGMNDVVVVLAVIGAVLALSRRRLLISAVIFALACTLKQSAWFIAPFYLLLLMQSFSPEERLKQTAKYVLIIGLVTLAVIGPFAIWSLPDFITDAFAYPSGGVDVNFPIRGYTIGVLLVGTGFISSPLDPFPFWLLQLVFGLPLLAWLIKYQWRENNRSRMLFCSGVFILGMGLVSRFFQDNYVGFVLTFIIFGFLLNLEEVEEYEPLTDAASGI